MEKADEVYDALRRMDAGQKQGEHAQEGLRKVARPARVRGRRAGKRRALRALVRVLHDWQ